MKKVLFGVFAALSLAACGGSFSKYAVAGEGDSQTCTRVQYGNSASQDAWNNSNPDAQDTCPIENAAGACTVTSGEGQTLYTYEITYTANENVDWKASCDTLGGEWAAN